MSPRPVVARRADAGEQRRQDAGAERVRDAAPSAHELRAAGIEPKLYVAPEADAAEREADRVADAVMGSRAARGAWSSAPPASAPAAATAAAPPLVDRALRAGRGRPLESPVRHEMETAFGRSFGDVRVHTHDEAAASARAIGARAYTRGRDVAFGAGEYAPSGGEGKRLLAHELTHVARRTSAAGDEMLRRTSEGGASAASAPTMKAFLANPPIATFSVSVSGLSFRGDDIVLAPGESRPQLMAVALHSLVRGQYTEKLVPQFLQVFASAQTTSTGFWQSEADQAAAEEASAAQSDSADASTAVSTGPRHAGPFGLDALTAVSILYALKARLGYQLATTPEQEQVLITGLLATTAWTELLAVGLGPGEALPGWYTKYMFDREMASRAADLDEYGTAFDLVTGFKLGDDPDADEFRASRLRQITDMLDDNAEVLDSVRYDVSLVVPTPGLEGMALRREAAAAAVYRELWVVDDAAQTLSEAPTVANNELSIVLLLAWVHSQPKLVERANVPGDRDARVELLSRFGRYVLGGRFAGSGDETLRDAPSTANAPPFPSALTAYPSLAPPVFEAPVEVERRFEMKLSFQTVAEAFSYYDFHWQLLPVRYTPPIPDDGPVPGATAIAQSVQPEEPNASIAPSKPQFEKPVSSFDDGAVAASLAAAQADLPALNRTQGQDVSDTDLLGQRYARALKYHEQDYAAIYRELGPFGLGAAELATVNAIIRYAGTGLATLLDSLLTGQSGNHSEKIVTFPQPGLYIVRCVGAPTLAGDEEIVRPPSVAYQPVFVRPSAEIAAAAVYGARQASDAAPAMKQALGELIADESISEEARAQFRSILEDVEVGEKGTKATLMLQLTRINQAIADAEDKNKKSSDAPTNLDYIAQLKDEQTRLSTILTMQADRALAHPEQLHATFVSDEGETMQLRMEASCTQDSAGAWSAKVSDLTRTGSGLGGGSGATKEAAIKSAISDVLEHGFGYGRGVVAIELGNRVETVEIASSVTQIGMEGIENVTTILSIAAIAASPFTGGASLTLMLPIGIAGTIPSFYRLESRREASNFQWDMQTWMDAANIVGAFVGAGQFAAETKAASIVAKGAEPGWKLVWAGRGLMVLNWSSNLAGVALLGNGVVQQLAALQNLSPAERKAKTMKILGGAMVNAGIMIGSAVAAEGAKLEAEARLSGHTEAGAPPGPESAPVRESAPVHATEQAPRLEGHWSPVEHAAPGSAEPAAVKQKPQAADPLLEGLARGDEGPSEKVAALHPELQGKVPPPMTWESGIPDHGKAMTRYYEARAAAPGREVAVWRKTGPRGEIEYAVTVGDKYSVHSPGAAWEGVIHYHPNADKTLRFQLPAPDDFTELMLRYDSAGGAENMREFVDSGMSGDPQSRVEFGITAGEEKPFYVTYDKDGQRTTERFRDEAEYTDFWGDETIVVTPETAEKLSADFDRDLAAARGDEVAPSVSEEGGKTTAGVSGSKKKPGSPAKKPKAKGEPDSNVPETKPLLTDVNGKLTDAGRAFVRKKFPSYKKKTDAQLNEAYSKRGNLLEQVVREEAIRAYEGVALDDPNAYLISKGYRGRTEEPNLREIITELREVLLKAGRTPGGDPSIVNLKIDQLIGIFPENARSPHINAELRKAALALQNHPDPLVRAEWQKFYYGRVLELEQRKLFPLIRDSGRRVPEGLYDKPSSPFGNGAVETRRPDVVELRLSEGEVRVTDVTQLYLQDVHNFKTLFYAVVLEQATGMPATAGEYRSLGQQKFVR